MIERIHGEGTGWFAAPNAIFYRTGLSVYAKIVYLYLCRRAGPDGCSWPSLHTIAKECSISNATTIKAIKCLEAESFVLVERKDDPALGHVANRYKFMPIPLSATTTSLVSQEVNPLSSKAAPLVCPADNPLSAQQTILVSVADTKDYQEKDYQERRTILSDSPSGRSSDGKETKGTTSPTGPPPLPPSVPDPAPAGRKKCARRFEGYSPDFEAFWTECPRKEGKGDAWKAWQELDSAPPPPALAERMRAYAARVRKERKEPCYVKLPAGWLRERRFDDEADRPQGNVPGSPTFDWATYAQQ